MLFLAAVSTANAAPKQGSESSRDNDDVVQVTEGRGHLVNQANGLAVEVPIKVSTSRRGGLRQTKVDIDIRKWMLDSTESDVTIQLSGGRDKDDSSFSANVELKLFWSEYTDGAGRHVAIDHYETKWTKLDPQISWNSAKGTAGCWSTLDNGNVCNASEVTTFGTPTSGTWYTNTPSWAGQFGLVHGLRYFANRSEIKLVRGGTTWTFTMVGCHGGNTIMTCDFYL